MPSNANSREFTRAQIRAEADIISGETRIHGQIRDLSMQGVLVSSRAILPEDTVCAIELYLTDQPLRIKAKGRIARTLKDGMAIEFAEINLDSFEHLRNLVRIHTGSLSQVDEELKNHLGLKRSRILGDRK